MENCFIRTISQFINGNENLHKNLRDQVYNYVSNNIINFYEYCYVENNTYYIDIEENSQIKKYVLDDYVANIKKNKFFSGFIEINAMSIILNRPIIILEKFEYEECKFYSKVVHFNNSEFENIIIKDIIFIDYENKNHYMLLTPKKNFIIDRINKKTFPKYKQIIMIK